MEDQTIDSLEEICGYLAAIMLEQMLRLIEVTCRQDTMIVKISGLKATHAIKLDLP